MRQSVDRHGDCVRVRLGEHTIQIFAGYADARTILVDHADDFGPGELARALGQLTGATDEVWRALREVAAPLLVRPQVRARTPELVAHVERTLARWDQDALAGETIELLGELRQLSLEILLGELGFIDPSGLPELEELSSLVSSLDDAIDVPTCFHALHERFDPHGRGQARVTKAIARLRELIEALVDRRLADTNQHDDLNRSAQRPASWPECVEVEEDGRRPPGLISRLATSEWLSERDAASRRAGLRDGVIALLLAAVGPSASAMFWTVHALATHEDVLARLDATLAATPFDPHVTRPHPEIGAVIDEALRLYPPIWLLARAARIDTQVGAWTVPAGATVLVSPWLTHRGAEWNDPNAFRPERFEDRGRVIPRTIGYFPFGLGDHTCVGRHLAKQQLAVFLPLFIRRYRFRALDRGPLALASSWTLVPRELIAFELDLREPTDH